MPTSAFDPHPDHARELDAADPLAPLAGEFEIPRGPDGRVVHYLCGHSLGLMPKAARTGLLRELDRWSERGVAGHFESDGWFDFHERFAAPLACLTGAAPNEVVAMNSLTVNLHLMLASFFAPSSERNAILIEHGAFPSDRFAVQSQLAWHGLDRERDLIETGGDAATRLDADGLDAALAAAGGRVALVLLPGVQYLTGEAVDLAACTAVARRHGCRIGFDLAHAIGNVELDLTAAAPDFAVWCSYKYLNGGPGAVGGCYVNRRWLQDAAPPRLEGWWGQDKHRRFDRDAAFAPPASADAWQLSNPPILAMAPLAASLDLFLTAGPGPLRRKSVALTSYLVAMLEHACGDRIEILTPGDPAARGAQVSVRLPGIGDAGPGIATRLAADGIVVDWRPPDVLRLAPVPLYNNYRDVHTSVMQLTAALPA